MGIKSQPLKYTKEWVQPTLRCTTSSISISKVQSPSVVNLTTISHQKAVSKDCCLLWKVYKNNGMRQSPVSSTLMKVGEMQVSSSIIIWQEWLHNEAQSFSK